MKTTQHLIQAIKTDASYAWDRNWDEDPEMMKRFEQTIQNAFNDIYASAKREVIEAIENGLHKDHSKCPIPQSCIGYQNCVSDIDNILEPFKNKSDTTS